ncbi:hypothetical protein GCM10027589_30140 [Actinocorallia lasiicapitis]
MVEIALIMMIPLSFLLVIVTIVMLTVRSTTRRVTEAMPRSPLDAFFAEATYNNGGHAHPRHENRARYGAPTSTSSSSYDHSSSFVDYPSSYDGGHSSHSGWSSSDSSCSSDSGSSSSSSSDSGSSSSSSCD